MEVIVTEAPARVKAGLVCPSCGAKFEVLKTRCGVNSIRRRRACKKCGYRVWTAETIVHRG